ncbi:MAG: ATP-binding protein [Rubrivivax sp.]|nr:ATP-binding protein [Rubrivivax sp.]
MRFYAGQPLHVEGRALGTLCVIDHQPRTWSDEDASFLQSMSQAAQALLARDVMWRRSAISEARLADFARASSDFLWECDAALSLKWIGPHTEPVEAPMATTGVGQPLWNGVLLDPVGQPDPRGLTLHAAMQSGMEFHRRTVECPGLSGSAWISVSAVPVRDASGQLLGWRGSVRDVTSHVAAQRQLRVQDERLQRICRHVPGLLYEYQRDPGGRGHFPFVSEGAQDLLGLLPQSLGEVGDDWLHGVHPDDRARLASSIDESSARLATWRAEFRVTLPQRGERWLESHASPRRSVEGQGRTTWHGFLADVTDRRAAQDELTDTRSRLQLALASARMGVLCIDPESEVVTADASARALHGLPAGDADLPLGDWLKALSHDDQTRLLKAIAEIVQFGSADRLMLATEQGANRLIELMLSPSQGSHDVIGVCRDASEQARAEQALKAAADAEQRRRDYSEFLSRVSHELRTPLNAVLGFSHLLLQQAAPSLPEHQVRWLHQIRRGGQYLLSLIEDLLSLTRTDSGHHRLNPQPTSMHAALRDVTELLAPLANAAEVVFDLPSDQTAAIVHVDRRALRQILVNILGNAVKYNFRGGHVRIDLAAQHGHCRVAVCDDGPGVAPEALHRLFEPFERLGAELGTIPGTGLGLAIARRLVEDSGGSIEAQCPAGSGLCVLVSLPFADTDHADFVDSGTTPLPMVAAPSPANAGARRARAVFVEDNEVNLQLMQAMFQRHRAWALELHDDAPRALHAILASPPDLLLLDLHMPGLCGLSLVRAVRADPGCRTVFCVAVTADSTEQTRANALAAGFDDVWTKPVDAQWISRLLDRLTPLTAARTNDDGSAALSSS